METINSLQNGRIKKWTLLHTKKGRDEQHRFLVEGEHLLEEALKAGTVEYIVTDEDRPETDVPVIRVTEGIMKKLSENVSAVHVIGVCRMQEMSVLKEERLLLLDGVQDPGNAGTLIRTAVSFGFDAVYMSKDSCDLYNEKTIRSTQGAFFHIPVIRTDLKDLIRQLQKSGVTVIATALDASENMENIPPSEKIAFVLGNEGQGVSKMIQEASDLRLRIEMNGFESLNVAVAGGIVMYRYRK
ncbi:MAG: RNA methyltransferase [Erysipelotrichaceae bacterium]|nr:RNA methyltransferase [Erysipelotrichaceae bacterium]